MIPMAYPVVSMVQHFFSFPLVTVVTICNLLPFKWSNYCPQESNYKQHEQFVQVLATSNIGLEFLLN